MPAASAASVISISRWSCGLGPPTGNEIAASAVQPSSTAPQSTLSRSPSLSWYLPGMPCSTASFTDVQMTAGKGVLANLGR